MARSHLLILTLLALGCASQRDAYPSPTDTLNATDELNQMMHDSATAWTNDDLDAFMLAFHNSPDLVFAIPTGITRGWQPLKERYAKSIAKSSLYFTDVEVTVITPEVALVFAQFHNIMKDNGSYATGLTTLLCKKINGNWVIVHDHSSGLPADTPRKDPVNP